MHAEAHGTQIKGTPTQLKRLGRLAFPIFNIKYAWFSNSKEIKTIIINNIQVVETHIDSSKKYL